MIHILKLYDIIGLFVRAEINYNKTRGSNKFDISENEKMTIRFLIGLNDILMDWNGN